MQRPTCTEVRIKTVADAHVIFYAVSLGILPMVNRRLDSEERRNLKAGDVYCWEERGPDAEATGLGIERWTDGIRWGPSRVRDASNFLFYHEKDNSDMDLNLIGPSTVHRHLYVSRFNLQLPPGAYYGRREKLIKQTYSVFIDAGERRRKWHMIGYFTQETANTLYSVRDFTHLAHLEVPPGSFRSARSAKGRPRTIDHMLHTVDSGRHTPSPKRGSPSSSPYAFTHRRSPIPIRPSTGSPSSHNDSRYRSNAVDHNSGLHLDPLEIVAPQPMAEVDLAPLAFLENSHIPKRHPVDDRALRAFSLSP
ncbi:uncharacterized protein STEHIDRAFT_64307 [Stereum hirsutum FP-91666 SS1]|uniref:uncharacterized protein n=1 Tax=Stereum hirsutum (strain FP-91666) TaxID=721885 RepID=UPI0004449547|nr:uncharacterized protein STEHIDRAFT_64307 [Stereum hirsutum FP-91666 SS1]EIM83018.1 hypothetical protein STEHIDRAFT_64307 [Stereum hirsutum FP-91666 SS1]